MEGIDLKSILKELEKLMAYELKTKQITEESIKAVFPLVKKYGGAVIAVTLDENGIPETAEGRVQIAKKINWG